MDLRDRIEVCAPSSIAYTFHLLTRQHSCYESGMDHPAGKTTGGSAAEIFAAGETRREAIAEASTETALERRRRTFREASARRRAKIRNVGDREYRIVLTAMESAEFERLRNLARCGPDALPARALLTGARFTAKARQGKKPVKCIGPRPPTSPS